MPTVRSFAKINLHLRILQKRSDGFHELETVFQSISLADTLTFERSDRLSLSCSEATIPTDSRNLVYRAANVLMREHGTPPFRIHMEKRIPAGGGLGGGSSNAATALLAIRQLSGANIPDDSLQSIALSLGSDVPFFLRAGTCYATGRGESLTPLSPAAGVPLLLVLPERGVPTKLAFGELSEERARGARIDRPLGVETCGRILSEGSGSWGAFTNDLEPPVFALFPELRGHLEKLRATSPVWARMTGSGSTLVAAYRSEETRDIAAEGLAGLRVVRAETISALTALQDLRSL